MAVRQSINASARSAPFICWPSTSLLRFIMDMGAELVVAVGTLCESILPAYRGRWISMLGIVVMAICCWLRALAAWLFPTSAGGTCLASPASAAVQHLSPRRISQFICSIASACAAFWWVVIVMLAALCTAILTLRAETAKVSLDDNSAGGDAGPSPTKPI